MKQLLLIILLFAGITTQAQERNTLAELSVNTKQATYTAQVTQFIAGKPLGVTIGVTDSREALLTLRGMPKIENSNFVLNFQQGITWNNTGTFYYQATGAGYDFGKSILLANLTLRNTKRDLQAGIQLSIAFKF